MRPCNVEIFDRNFNFIYSAIIDNEEFQYAEDCMDPVKSSVELPLDFVPEKLAPQDSNAPKDWYIRILDNGSEYQGVITVYEAKDTRCKVTFSQMITLLNINVLADTPESISSLETYIKNLILAEFVNTSDTNQRIAGLSTVTTTSNTPGTFPFTDTDDEYVSINILDDVIYTAFELYSIVTKVQFNVASKTINITVGVNNATRRTIEADLPNITESTFTIQKYSKQVNKVDCYDIYTTPPTKKSFFLHTNGTWNDNGNTDRILPVVNSVVMINGWELSKKGTDTELAAQIERLKALNKVRFSLTPEEKSELDILAAKFMPSFALYNQLPAPSISGSDDGSVHIGGTNYQTYTYKNQYVTGAEWYDYGTGADSRLELSYVTTLTSYHIGLEANVSATRTREVNGITKVNVGSFTLGRPITDDDLQRALSIFKNTEAYYNEISSGYAQLVAEAMEARAGAVFAKNKYSNLIELTMRKNDTMVKPTEMDIGQEVNVIHNGVAYRSILSGKEYEDGMATLTFGTIRLELTSWLKGRY